MKEFYISFLLVFTFFFSKAQNQVEENWSYFTPYDEALSTKVINNDLWISYRTGYKIFASNTSESNTHDFKDFSELRDVEIFNSTFSPNGKIMAVSTVSGVHFFKDRELLISYEASNFNRESYVVCDSKGIFWFYLNKQFYTFDSNTEKLTRIISRETNNVAKIYVNKNDDVFILVEDSPLQGIYKLTTSGTIELFVERNTSYRVSKNYNLVEDPNGNFLINYNASFAAPEGTTFYTALISKNGSKTLFKRKSSSFPMDIVTCVKRDAFGVEWWGASNGLFKKEGELFVKINSYIITGLDFFDGKLTVTTANYGAFYLENNTLKSFKTRSDELPFSNVGKIEATEDGSIWMFAPAGIFKLKNGAFHILENIPDDIPMNYSPNRSIVDKYNNFWIKTNNDKFYKYNGQKWLEFSAPKDSKHFVVDDSGTSWFIQWPFPHITSVSADEQTTTIYDKNNSSIPNSGIKAVYNNGKYIWTLHENGSYARFDGDSWTLITSSQFKAGDYGEPINVTNDGKLIGFRNDFFLYLIDALGVKSYPSLSGINSIEVSQFNDIWLGSRSNGILSLRNNVFKEYTSQKTGLYHNTVYYAKPIFLDNIETIYAVPSGSKIMSVLSRIFKATDPVKISTNLKSTYEIEEGGTLALSLSVENVQYIQWEFNENGMWKNISPNSLFVYSTSSNGNNYSLLLNNLTHKADKIQVRASVENQFGVLTTNTAILSVLPLDFIIHPESQETHVGFDLEFTSKVINGKIKRWEFLSDKIWKNIEESKLETSITDGSLIIKKVPIWLDGVKIRSVAENSFITKNSREAIPNIALPLSIEDFKENVKIYPNPTTDYIFLDFTPSNKYFKISLVNSKGEFQVFSTIDVSKISLKHLSSGVYFLSVQDKNETVNKTFKIVKL